MGLGETGRRLQLEMGDLMLVSDLEYDKVSVFPSVKWGHCLFRWLWGPE